MTEIAEQIRSFLLALAVIPGLLAMAFAAVYLTYQMIVFMLLKGSAEEVYRYRSQSLAEIRTHITLPLMSILVAVIAGAGVNLATGARDKDDVSLGMQLIFFGIGLVVFLGWMMVVTHRPFAFSRGVELRISRIAAALDDPFVSVERAVQLRPEVRRHMKVGQRIAQRHDATTYREWLINTTQIRDIRVSILWAYGAGAVAFVRWIWQVLHTDGLRNPGWTTFVFIALVGGLLGPVLHFHNYRKRCLRFGTFLHDRSADILVKIELLERKYGLLSATTPGPCRQRPRSIGARLRYLLNMD